MLKFIRNFFSRTEPLITHTGNGVIYSNRALSDREVASIKSEIQKTLATQPIKRKPGRPRKSEVITAKPNQSYMTNESGFWRPVLGYENLYDVSRNGEIRYSQEHPKRRGRLRVFEVKFKQSDYKALAANLVKDGKKKQVLVHRIVAQHFLGQDISGMSIRHKDGNHLNNDISNLETYRNKDLKMKKLSRQVVESNNTDLLLHLVERVTALEEQIRGRK